ncbi:hypothetical protein BBK82_26565 [Lentzea guizhouensis]|uniref:DUF4194 domain-containing protein n=1 Tax=Lentzea guizhouensis TaxID=1586287 RepID=A0A1B2HN00_9PSEU|nr:DUF4194 domain-containing protein [Lentzea guizhouensis]ANZ39107.1 hypothetical protein BBK82_26565 [Lentzea guizhouensis]
MAEHVSFADVFSQDLVEPVAEALDPSTIFTDDDDAPIGNHVDHGERTARFDGDTSELPPQVCWALQELLAAPHITEKSKHWPIVQQYETLLRSRLAELGLLLELNRDHRFAFTRQAEDPSPHSRVILRAKTLSLAASALALYLYTQYVVSPSDPIVDRADMVEHMLAYRPSNDTDEVGFRKKVDTAVKSLEDVSIIKPVRGRTDRYTIYPVITAILTADQVTALDERYRAIASGNGPATGDGGEEEQPE